METGFLRIVSWFCAPSVLLILTTIREASRLGARPHYIPQPSTYPPRIAPGTEGAQSRRPWGAARSGADAPGRPVKPARFHLNASCRTSTGPKDGAANTRAARFIPATPLPVQLSPHNRQRAGPSNRRFAFGKTGPDRRRRGGGHRPSCSAPKPTLKPKKSACSRDRAGAS